MATLGIVGRIDPSPSSPATSTLARISTGGACLEPTVPPKTRPGSSRTLRERRSVCILLGTHNGQRFLAEQLSSIARQVHEDWRIFASDDGSQDATRDILAKAVAQLGESRVRISTGPGCGFARNFLALVCDSSIKGDFYAYCDQDDVWEPEKLDRAVAWLGAVSEDTPALYCSRTRLVDEFNRDAGFSPLFHRAPGFANALMQNIAGGNTMVFNDAARKLLLQAGSEVDVVSHDWWTYLVVTACGGRVFYDSHPTVRYRQHATNIVGRNSSWLARIDRLQTSLQGRLREWNDSHVRALLMLNNRTTPANRRILRQFMAARRRPSSVSGRLICLRRSGVYRQTFLGNLSLVFASLLNKI